MLTETPNRSATVTRNHRADQLTRGDVIIFADWNGLKLCTVVDVADDGEDVDLALRAADGTVFSAFTSPGNCFDVVETNERVAGPGALRVAPARWR